LDFDLQVDCGAGKHSWCEGSDRAQWNAVDTIDDIDIVVNLNPERRAEGFAVENPEDHVHRSVEWVASRIGQDALEVRLLRHGCDRDASARQENE
jgi:hypothetical protein